MSHYESYRIQLCWKQKYYTMYSFVRLTRAIARARTHGMIIACDISHTWIRKHKFWNWKFSFVEARILQVYKTRGAWRTIAIINMLILCFQLSIKIFKSTTACSELRSFLSYGKSDILGLGYKTEEVNGRVYVNFFGAKFVPKTKTGSYKSHSSRQH